MLAQIQSLGASSRCTCWSRNSFVQQRSLQATRPQRCLVVVMAKPSKAADLRSLSDEDIEKQVYDCKKALLDMRIAQASRKPYKPDEFGWNKNKIAQLLTISRERELEKGIDRRASRKLAKNKKLASWKQPIAEILEAAS